jgi:flagellar hook-basal body complex protein FliE
MTVTPLPPIAPAAPAFEPDVPDEGRGIEPFASFGEALRSAGAQASSALERAQRAEAAFVGGRGGLQEMVVERAQADVLLTIASTAAARAAQSLSTVFNLQV